MQIPHWMIIKGDMMEAQKCMVCKQVYFTGEADSTVCPVCKAKGKGKGDLLNNILGSFDDIYKGFNQGVSK